MKNCPVALIVGGDHQVRQVIAASLGELGCATCDAAAEDGAFERAARTSVDVVIVDVCKTDAAGWALIRTLRATQPHLRVLYLIGALQNAIGKPPAARPHDAYLHKPFHLNELCDIVASWLEHATLPVVTSALVH